MADVEIEKSYLAAQARLSGRARALSPDELATPVPTCPGWTIKDVLGHLVGLIDDVLAGRLAGPPDDSQTASQVDAYRTVDISELLDRWDAQAPVFANLVAEVHMWPAAFDVMTHELDVLAALGDKSNRTGEQIEDFARRLYQIIDVGRPLRIETDTQVLGDPDADLTLSGSDFELVRVRLGRRSATQVRAMNWSSDIGDDALRLCFFGPSPTDIIE